MLYEMFCAQKTKAPLGEKSKKEASTGAWMGLFCYEIRVQAQPRVPFNLKFPAKLEIFRKFPG